MSEDKRAASLPKRRRHDNSGDADAAAESKKDRNARHAASELRRQEEAAAEEAEAERREVAARAAAARAAESERQELRDFRREHALAAGEIDPEEMRLAEELLLSMGAGRQAAATLEKRTLPKHLSVRGAQHAIKDCAGKGVAELAASKAAEAFVTDVAVAALVAVAPSTVIGPSALSTLIAYSSDAESGSESGSSGENG